MRRTGFYSGILECAEFSGSLDIGCLFAFGALGYFERNLLSFLEGLEPPHLDRREVREQIFTAVIRRNEAITLRIVEPFHGTCCHIAVPLINKKLPEKISGDCLSFKDAYGKTGTAIELEAKHLFAF